MKREMRRLLIQFLELLVTWEEVLNCCWRIEVFVWLAGFSLLGVGDVEIHLLGNYRPGISGIGYCFWRPGYIPTLCVP